MDIFLGEAGNVAAEPYLTSERALEHPQIVHNGNVQDVHASLGVGDTRQLRPDGEHERDAGSERRGRRRRWASTRRKCCRG